MQWHNWRVSWCPETGGKNDHNIFASSLDKLPRASVIEGPKFATGGPKKQELMIFGLNRHGWGEILLTIFLNVTVRKIFSSFFNEYGSKNVLGPPLRHLPPGVALCNCIYDILNVFLFLTYVHVQTSKSTNS
jgi:hypothetical protein